MILDANVLLYAVDEQSPFHGTARSWITDLLNGPERVGFPWATLTAFCRISTDARILARPLPPATAWSVVTDWLDAQQAWIPTPGPRHREVLGELLTEGNVTGRLVPDAHLAALAIEHGTSVHSFDSDFALFRGLTWVCPRDGVPRRR